MFHVVLSFLRVVVKTKTRPNWNKTELSFSFFFPTPRERLFEASTDESVTFNSVKQEVSGTLQYKKLWNDSLIKIPIFVV